jgi:hypothetical protein
VGALTALSDRGIAVRLFVLAFVAYAWFFNGGGWNQNAVFDLTRAMVERRTFAVDGYHVNTGDLTTVRGENYINKPPGASLLAAIPYAPIYAVERALRVPMDSWFMMTLNAYLVTVLSCGVTGALIPVVLFLYARRRFDVSRRAALAVALTIAFCTIVWPYSTMLFAHVPSALFLLLAFVLVRDRPLLAGLAAGAAGTTFYLCIAAALALLLMVRSWRSLARFVAGGIPFAILLCWYQYVCFGSPFRTAVEDSTRFTDRTLFLGVFRLPTFDALSNLTVTPYRGLFFGSSVLLFAIAGAAVMFRRREARRELAAIAVMVFLFVGIVAGFNGWHGGSAWGPRYLLPIVPLLGILMLFAVHLAKPLWIALAAISFSMQFIATSVDPLPPATVGNPLMHYQLFAFRTGRWPNGSYHGKVSINEQAIDSAGPYAIHQRGSHETIWASFNLGELLVGARRRSSVVPVFLWIVLGSVYLLRTARR